MKAQVAPVHGDEQQALARERGKQSDDAEIPHMAGFTPAMRAVRCARNSASSTPSAESAP